MTALPSPSVCYEKHSYKLLFDGYFRHFSLKKLTGAALLLALAGCAVGPAYQRPTAAAAAAWKELPTAQGWQVATPGELLPRGDWWKLFNDPVLDGLVERVQVSNQNIAAAVASYEQAQALVREQRAALFPSVSLGGGATRSGSRTTGVGNAVSANLSADWAPDVWGRLGNTVKAAQANAQASEADLAAARLSAIGSLTTDYLSLRAADAVIALLDQTIAGYQRALAITRNQYAAGIAAQSDVLQAQTTLINAQASRVGEQRSRATLEHAIAMLVGVAPADFSLPVVADWTPTVPDVPVAVPSLLLQRRPDVAAAERAVAAANAQIGVARAAYFPAFSLSASDGRGGSRVADLFSAPNNLWSLGLSVTQVVFDAGAIGATVDAAKAGHANAVALYRQSALAAFQSVEDQLATAATLAQQEQLQRDASVAADKAEQILLNQYVAAQVDYTDVVAAQAAALSARQALAQTRLSRQTAAVALIQALGGGWATPWTDDGQVAVGEAAAAAPAASPAPGASAAR